MNTGGTCKTNCIDAVTTVGTAKLYEYASFAGFFKIYIYVGI